MDAVGVSWILVMDNVDVEWILVMNDMAHMALAGHGNG